MSDKTPKGKAKAAHVIAAEQRAQELLAESYSVNEIQNILAKETGRSIYQCKRYVKAAINNMQEQFDLKVDERRSAMKTGLEGDLRLAYQQFRRDPNPKWMTAILQIKDRIMLLEPNQLRPVEVEDNKVTQYNFTFTTPDNKKKKDDDDDDN